MLLVNNIVERNRRRYPGKPALSQDGTSISYEQFYQDVKALTWYFQSQGLQKGERVAVLSQNSARQVEVMFAAACSGCVAVPINYRLSPAEIGYILRDSTPALLFCQEAQLPNFAAVETSEKESLRGIILLDGQAGASCHCWPEVLRGDFPSELYSAPGLDEDTLACLFYTSGTTGRPKGVMQSHRNLMSVCLNNLYSYQYIEEGDVTLITAPLFHGGGFNSVRCHLYVGATSIVLQKFDPAQVLRLIAAEGITTLWLTPTMLQALLDWEEVASTDFSLVKTITCGGSPLTFDLWCRASEVLGPAKVMNGYGLTESGPAGAHFKKSDYYPFLASCGNSPPAFVPIGKETLEMEVLVVDDNGRELPPGEVGEIVIRGDAVMQGYWRDAELTHQVLLDGWLHTGDQGMRDDQGYLHLVGRKKEVIISGGENIYPMQIEEVIARHPWVERVAVVGVPDSYWGEKVKAFIVPWRKELDETEVLRHCRDHLARYKVPKEVEFRDSLPENPSGKVMKHLLIKPYLKSKDENDG